MSVHLIRYLCSFVIIVVIWRLHERMHSVVNLCYLSKLYLFQLIDRVISGQIQLIVVTNIYKTSKVCNINMIVFLAFSLF